MPGQPTTAIYLRQSLDKTGLEAAVDRQRDETLNLIHGLDQNTTWREYKDNDTSAYNLKKPRKDYQRLLQDIRNGDIKLITCWHPDRLYRRVKDLYELIDACEAHGVEIRTVRAGHIDLTTPMGRTQAKLAAVLAEGEMEQKSDRQQAMHRQRAKDGRHWWTQRPFGYNKTLDKHGRPGAAELHPTEAPLVADAYEKVLNGISLNSIMQQWNKQGITSSTGHQWRNQRLRQLLLNPRNAALREHTNTKGETTLHPASWPPIIPEDIYQAVKHILENPERDLFTKNGGRARKHLLVGLAKCGKCGHTVRSGQSRRGKHQYVCHNCHGIGREMQLIDKAITKLAAGRLARPDARDLIANQDADTTALRNQSATIRTDIDKAENDYEEGIVDGRAYQKRRLKLDTQLATITTQMTDANKAKIYAGLIGAPDVHTTLLEKPLDQQRAVIDSLLDITIHPGHRGKPLTEKILPDIVKVKWKTP